MANQNQIQTNGTAGHARRNEFDREAVVSEMENILADPVFRRSQRCTSLLRYMVDHALEENGEGLKERTLGIEVFGRDVDYDSSTDPIVRMAANEIRKRLAQYYQNDDRPHVVRIRLVPGRYVPEFDFLEAASVNAEREEDPAQPDPLQAEAREPATTPAVPIKGRRWSVPLVVALLGIGTVLVWGRGWLFPDAQDLLWRPLMQATPVLICVADNSSLQKKSQGQMSAEETRTQMQRIANMIQSRQAPSIADPTSFDPTTPFMDANVAHEITAWLGNHSRSSMLRASSTLALPDFRKQPVVLVGGFDNPWTVILLSDLRFSLRADPSTATLWIRDAQHPEQHDWSRHVLEEVMQPSFDYAVITRLRDAETGNWVIAIAGLGPHGTEAASQLLLNHELVRDLPHGIRSAGNFQIVTRTTVINGSTGSPQVLAFHTW